MRKENEEFKQIYEGNKNNHLIEGLCENTNYEIKLYSSNDNNNEPLNKSIKTLCGIIFDNNSLIIGNNKEYSNILKNWINPYKNIRGELLYRLTRDGPLYQAFHNRCDNKGPTLTLINDENNLITGGFTPLNWDSNSEWKRDNETFLFNLSNKKNIIITLNQYIV